MRYRNKSKVKTKHHLIDGLEDALNKIGEWPEVSSINPGEITPCRHNDRLKITVQRTLAHGLRCLARSHGAVQELYIISGDPVKLKEKLSQFIGDL